MVFPMLVFFLILQLAGASVAKPVPVEIEHSSHQHQKQIRQNQAKARALSASAKPFVPSSIDGKAKQQAPHPPALVSSHILAADEKVIHHARSFLSTQRAEYLQSIGVDPRTAVKYPIHVLPKEMQQIYRSSTYPPSSAPLAASLYGGEESTSTRRNKEDVGPIRDSQHRTSPLQEQQQNDNTPTKAKKKKPRRISQRKYERWEIWMKQKFGEDFQSKEKEERREDWRMKKFGQDYIPNYVPAHRQAYHNLASSSSSTTSKSVVDSRVEKEPVVQQQEAHQEGLQELQHGRFTSPPSDQLSDTSSEDHHSFHSALSRSLSGSRSSSESGE